MNRRRMLRTFAATVLVVTLLSACTGYAPGRKQASDIDRVEQVAPVEAAVTPGEAAAAAPTTATVAPTSGAPRAAATPPRVVARTNTGTTVTQSQGGLPKADIWPDSQDRVGITANQIKLCMHAAFVLGPAFDNRPEDEDVYWRLLNDSGGIHGRKVAIELVDDAYLADGTTQALDKCAANNPFLYMGGVGFDQAPAGRNWAEGKKQPYLYNMAVEASGLKHSFTFLPSINANGRFIGEYTGAHLPGRKVGILYVNTDNWRAGVDEFERAINKRGMTVPASNKHPIPNNNYPDFGVIIRQMQEQETNYVLTYINALALNRFIAQADEQGFHPIVFSPDGFDLVTDTVGNTPNHERTDHIDHLKNFEGVYAGWPTPAYEIGPPDSKARPSVPWYQEMQKMKAAYAKYNVKTPQRVNDVDWMFWLHAKTIHQMLLDCSKECSRNILAGMMLTGYKTEIVGCPVDFGLGNGRVGGHHMNVYKSTQAGPSSFWRQTETCKQGF